MDDWERLFTCLGCAVEWLNTEPWRWFWCVNVPAGYAVGLPLTRHLFRDVTPRDFIWEAPPGDPKKEADGFPVGLLIMVVFLLSPLWGWFALLWYALTAGHKPPAPKDAKGGTFPK